jgi:hypothetical protein
MQVGPRILVGVRLSTAGVGPASGPAWRLSHSTTLRMLYGESLMEYTGPSFSPVVLLRVVRLHWRLGLPAVGHGLGLLLGRAEQRGVARVPPAVELDEGDLGFGRVVASEK